MESVKIIPLEYGYELEDDNEEQILSKIIEENLPDELPIPFKYVKCTKSNICCCRVKKIRCCQCCNYKPKCVKIR